MKNTSILDLMKERFPDEKRTNMSLESGPLNDYLKKLFPLSNKTTDVVKINSINELEKFYDRIPESSLGIPADFIFADTIPIENLSVEFKNNAGTVIKTRFDMIPRNLKELAMKCIVSESNPNENVLVACCTVVMDGMGEFRLPFIINRNDLKHMCYNANICFEPKTETAKDTVTLLNFLNEQKDERRDEFMKYFERAVDIDLIASLSGMTAVVWFVVNACLLNPIIKVSVKSKTECVVDDKKKPNKNKKTKPPKKRYVKHIYLDFDEIDKMSDDSYIATTGTGDGTGKHSKHSIHCPVWYVTGHWREYKSGHKVFIQGYWKGIARAYKNSEPRERDIPNDEVLDNLDNI